MNCKQARENFFEVLDKAAMNPEPGPALATHLAGCAECAAELASLKSTMALLDSWKAPAPSAYFNTRMQAKLAEARREDATQAASWMSRLWTPAVLRPALVAAMGLAFVVGMNFYQSAVVNPAPNRNIVATQQQGTAVADLQALDRNQDLYSDFDLLDDIGSSHAPASSPAVESTGSQL
jgi:anti-sigma factor RsiW